MRLEAEGLLAQARKDPTPAQVLLRGERHYAVAFFAQQAVEKVLKALHVERLRTLPRTHDLLALGAPEGGVEGARLLTPDYTVSRYPDAAGTLPARLYGRARGEARLQAAEEVLTGVERSPGKS
ncbi:HEPN domain-containing protein [Thermus thermamylovorans]|uniref:HEPN domain-containing protein n=1 Tax=Thermus thermamylovorans TaxID=2509362 RepID=A0A4Q9B8L7_9DEIN|nr:HEPN domain-containing protein [Thermus thermamylovorans]TBH21563.1 HEPN domain-containing protein [Thermus thermamylovorans]